MNRLLWAVVAGIVGVLGCVGVARAQCGVTWETRTSATYPFVVAPTAGRFTYDTVRQRVVYCGARELWEWDGTAWSRRAQWSGPNTPDDLGVVTFDSVRGRLVLLQDAPGITPRKTWEWDGTGWTLAATFGAPAGANLTVFIPSRGVVLLVQSPSVGTWEWNGSFWVQVANTGPLSISDVCYDSARDRVVAIGTNTPQQCGGPSEPSLWEWNPTTRAWSMVSSTGPTSADARLYFDSIRNRSVYVGTLGNRDLWEWDGSKWQYLGEHDWVTCSNDWQAVRFDALRGKGIAMIQAGNASQYWDVREVTIAAGVSIQSQPTPQTRNAGQSAGFTVGATGSGVLAYQWRRNGQPLANGANVTGAQSPALTLAGLSTSDTGAIDCIVSNTCGSVTTAPTVLVVNPACRADLDDGTGAGQPDGGITIDDLLFFLLKFEQGC